MEVVTKKKSKFRFIKIAISVILLILLVVIEVQNAHTLEMNMLTWTGEISVTLLVLFVGL